MPRGKSAHNYRPLGMSQATGFLLRRSFRQVSFGDDGGVQASVERFVAMHDMELRRRIPGIGGLPPAGELQLARSWLIGKCAMRHWDCGT